MKLLCKFQTEVQCHYTEQFIKDTSYIRT